MRIGRAFVRVQRCAECGRVLWPWQDAVQRDDWEYLVDHHACHHAHALFVWAEEWVENLACGCDSAAVIRPVACPSCRQTMFTTADVSDHIQRHLA